MRIVWKFRNNFCSLFLRRRSLHSLKINIKITTNFILFFVKSCYKRSNIPKNWEKTTALSSDFICFICYMSTIIFVLLVNSLLSKETSKRFYLGKWRKSYFVNLFLQVAHEPNYYICLIMQSLQKICKQLVITGD